MTIAVGILASEGVVLAADTQLTVANYWKGEGGKIMAVARKERGRVTGACAITGATSDYEYLHGPGDELTKRFLLDLDDADKDREFGAVLRRFYRRHVVPFALHAQPEINVLVAYQRDEHTALWQSNRNLLIAQYDHGAVGIGSYAASAWLNRVWKRGMDIPTSVIVAVFAAAVAKDSVDGVSTPMF
jgi:20S proteasome alpha/beta subunit